MDAAVMNTPGLAGTAAALGVRMDVDGGVLVHASGVIRAPGFSFDGSAVLPLLELFACRVLRRRVA